MLTPKSYVAVADFSLSLNNGEKNVNVRVGDELTFDGLYAKIGVEQGTAKPLSKVIGEWIKPVESSSPAPASAGPTLPPATPSRNATGGRIVEDSDPSSDRTTLSSQESSNAELKRLVDQYDNAPAPTHVSERTTDDMKDMRKESSVQVESYDDQEVAKVRADDTGANRNPQGIVMGQSEIKKATVVSDEERVVKKTNYSKKKSAGEAPRKKLTVDKDAQGTEVRKTSSPTEAATSAAKASTERAKPKVIREEDSVKDTDYGKQAATDVGSSTQAKIEQDAAMRPSKKSPEIIRDASDEGVVVRKVSKIDEESVATEDGITSRVTVGASDGGSDGEVTFSSNSDIIEGEATFSRGEATADLGAGSDDIDVNDILNAV